MAFDPIKYIKSRSREEWQAVILQKWADIRLLIQENGEFGFLAAFILGILVVLAFKLVLGISVVSILVALLVWNIAEPEANNHSNNSTPPSEK